MFLFLTTLLAKNSITFEFFKNKDVKMRILKNNQEIPFSETGIDLPVFDEVIISFKNNQYIHDSASQFWLALTDVICDVE